LSMVIIGEGSGRPVCNVRLSSQNASEENSGSWIINSCVKSPSRMITIEIMRQIIEIVFKRCRRQAFIFFLIGQLFSSIYCLYFS
jgi:hypothetical protein